MTRPKESGRLLVHFEDSGREPQCPPDLLYPHGKDIDVSEGAAATCSVTLPYPAKRIGLWRVECQDCGLTVGVTAAGRPDDPRSLKIACRLGATGKYPDGKRDPTDEGELTMAIGAQEDGTVRVDFGKKVAWVAFPPAQAIEFAIMMLKHAGVNIEVARNASDPRKGGQGDQKVQS